MEPTASWDDVRDALDLALSRIVDDPDPRNDREGADGHRYLLHMLSAVTQSTLQPHDPDRPAFRTMLEATRHLGAAGPDIDYDVAVVRPGRRYRVSGTRGGATYVGICLYDDGGAQGAAALLGNVDVDSLVAPDGTFSFDVEHPDAARVIVRQYFHDRATQAQGSWSIEGLDVPASPPSLPTSAEVANQLQDVARSLGWTASLNHLWGAEHRATPNRLVQQSAAEIVAAIPNPDVTYAFGWWRIAEGEALVVEHTPPERCRYWGLQLCDRWFQCYPDRRANLNDQQVAREPDGSVRFVIAGSDPGHPNWLDTSGHHTGIMFFRWLHVADPALPTVRVVTLESLR